MGSSALQGYRVIQVSPGSPMELGNLQSYLDFIVSANGVRVHNDSRFSLIISKSVNCPVVLKVFNVLTRRTREEQVVPKEWGGPGLLGGTVRFEEWTADDEFGVRVLGLIAGLPAESADLVPMDDYILGTNDDTVTSPDHLASLAIKAEGAITLYVFNAKDGKVRPVEIKLPEGVKQLGIDAGQGALHALEIVMRQPKPAVEEPKPASEAPKSSPETSKPAPEDSKANPEEPKSVAVEPAPPKPEESKLNPFATVEQPPAVVEKHDPEPPKPEHREEPKQQPEPHKPAEKTEPPPPRKDLPKEEVKAKPKVPPARPRVEFIPPKLPKDLPILKNPFQNS